MSITVTIRYSKVSYNLRFDDSQQISGLLRILGEAGLMTTSIENAEVKSLRRLEYLDLGKTFKEEEIFSGDILEVHV